MYRLTSLLASGSVLTWIYSIPLLGAHLTPAKIVVQSNGLTVLDSPCSGLYFTVSFIASIRSAGRRVFTVYFSVFTDHTCIPIRMDFINSLLATSHVSAILQCSRRRQGQKRLLLQSNRCLRRQLRAACHRHLHGQVHSNYE